MKTFFLLAMAAMTATASAQTDTLKTDTLTEVILAHKLPQTRLSRTGSIITTVQGTQLAEVGTADEMLARVPGMSTQGDALLVAGRGAPLIYINGRLMRDGSELSRILSQDVRDVEIIRNPGSRYDATTRAVVRIRTVRRPGDGVGVDLSLLDSQDLRYGFNLPSGRLGLNYRRRGLDLFGSATYQKQDYRQYSDLTETTFTREHEFTQTGPYTMTWKYQQMRYQGGFNYQIKDNHSIGARVDLTHRLHGGINQVIYDEDLLLDGVFQSHLLSHQTSHEERPVGTLTNAYYKGKAGELDIDFNIDYMTNGSDTERQNVETDAEGQEFIPSQSSARSRLFASKLELSHPLWGGQLTGGTELTLAHRETSYAIDRENIPDAEAKIQENTIAAFLSWDRDFRQYGTVSAGLRYEHTEFRYDDLMGTDSLHRPTDLFFPSLTYTLQTGPITTGLTYSAHTQRPDYFALNDAVTYISRYSVQCGNTKLLNEYIHSLSLSAVWKWMTLSLDYDHQAHAITQWSYILPGDIAMVKHINLERPIHTIGCTLTASPSVGMWSLNATANVSKQFLYIDLEDPLADNGIRRKYFDHPTFSGSMTHTLSMPHNWSIDGRLSYRSPGHSQNFYSRYHTASMGVTLGKTFLNKALNLRLGVSDILQRDRSDEVGDMGYYLIEQFNRYSRHRISFQLIYRFNSARSHYRGTGAGKEAQARMRQ